MEPSHLPEEVRAVLAHVVNEEQQVLDVCLTGIYLFGSVVTGDYRPGASDLDMVTVLTEDPTASVVARLERLHHELIVAYPRWDDRIEVTYLSRWALRHFRERSFPAARISPGEPFHTIDIDARWLIDWYPLRVCGIALYGPSLTEVVPPIAHEEYVAAVSSYLRSLPDSLDQYTTPAAQGYVVITACRALHLRETREAVSKRAAVHWARHRYPHHAAFIVRAAEPYFAQDSALVANDATFPAQMRKFLQDVTPQ